jgi:hypothetical protein
MQQKVKENFTNLLRVAEKESEREKKAINEDI